MSVTHNILELQIFAAFPFSNEPSIQPIRIYVILYVFIVT